MRAARSSAWESCAADAHSPVVVADFEEIIDTINKAQPYRRAEACKKLLCLCGGCFFLCGKRGAWLTVWRSGCPPQGAYLSCIAGYVQEIRRANIRQFEKLGLSLLYRHDKIPAVEDAHEYYACGVPMHLAEWLEIRPVRRRLTSR